MAPFCAACEAQECIRHAFSLPVSLRALTHWDGCRQAAAVLCLAEGAATAAFPHLPRVACGGLPEPGCSGGHAAVPGAHAQRAPGSGGEGLGCSSGGVRSPACNCCCVHSAADCPLAARDLCGLALLAAVRSSGKDPGIVPALPASSACWLRPGLCI